MSLLSAETYYFYSVFCLSAEKHTDQVTAQAQYICHQTGFGLWVQHFKTILFCQGQQLMFVWLPQLHLIVKIVKQQTQGLIYGQMFCKTLKSFQKRQGLN